MKARIRGDRSFTSIPQEPKDKLSDSLPLKERGQLAYRRDIDGLRAIAVMAVVAYHAGLGLRGGFVGVDVFFVVSGYLITSIIWGDLDQARFSLWRFWERRTRRILPALLAVCIVSLLVGWFILLPSDYVSLGRSAEFLAISSANFFFWRNTGYFAGPAELQPLLHTWSLSVEEQFYLAVPALLAALHRVPSPSRRVVGAWCISVAFTASFALSIYSVARWPTAAFYLLPSRAWELAVGSALALSNIKVVLSTLAREMLTVAGLLLVLLPALLYSRSTPFPGLAAAVPCLGTAALIWVGSTGSSAITKLLGAKMMVSVGLISYSLYLWHWPLLAFCRYWSLGQPGLPLRVGVVAVSFLLAFCSWKFVEMPTRSRKLIRTPKAVLAFALVGIFGLFLGGWAITALRGMPGRLPVAVRAITNEAAQRQFIRELTLEEAKAGELPSFGAASDNKPIDIVVWGDSHAMAALPALNDICNEARLNGRYATHSSTPPLSEYAVASEFGLRSHAKEYNDAVLSFIASHHVREVILIANWSSCPQKSNVAGSPSLTDALLETTSKLTKLGARPWLLLQVPTQPFDVPKALIRHVLFGLDFDGMCARPSSWNGVAEGGSVFISKLEKVGCNVIDPRPAFLDPTAKFYRISDDGLPLYVDSQHLTPNAAIRLLSPVFRSAMKLRLVR